MPVIVARRLRAPQEDRSLLADPPLAATGRILADNRRCFARSSKSILGRDYHELRAEARQAAISAARAYLASHGEPLPSLPDGPLLMAGHQPELFHPGVWVKNFALQGLGRTHGLTPLNLVVDNDSIKTADIKIPQIARFPVRAVGVPYDRGSLDTPYEERSVVDESLFESCPIRALPLLDGVGFTPMLADFWRHVVEQRAHTSRLGERFALTRRSVERAWGCHNLEVPVSALCRMDCFAWFIFHLFAELPRFHVTYNECLRDYRRIYRLRSHSHPVPDLASEGDWLEVPLWAWRADEPRRGRLMARLRGDSIDLRVGQRSWPSLPLADRDGDKTLVAWHDLDRQKYKVRSRALTNTLFARLFLADLFIHGIGGGKYDELTDEIIRRFYGFEPPAFLVLSGTLRLPLKTFPSSPHDCRRLAYELRDRRWNPQRHLHHDAAGDPRIEQLIADKKQWIARQTRTHTERRERFHVLRDLTTHLREALDGRPDLLHDQVQCREVEVQSNTVLRRRDYSFCLFPESMLREFCEPLLR